MLKLAQGYIEYVSYNFVYLVLLGNMKQYYSYIRRLSFLNILFETSVCDRRCFHHRPIHLSTIVIYQDHVVDSENPFDTDPLFHVT